MKGKNERIRTSLTINPLIPAHMEFLNWYTDPMNGNKTNQIVQMVLYCLHNGMGEQVTTSNQQTNVVRIPQKPACRAVSTGIDHDLLKELMG